MKDLFTFLIYSGVSITALLILLVVNRSKDRISNKVLIGVLTSLLILFLTYGAFLIDNQFLAKFIVPIGAIIPFSLGVLLFYYIQSIYSSKVSFHQVLKSLIPFIVAFLLYTLPSYFIEKHTIFVFGSYIIPLLGSIHFVYYLVKSFKVLKSNRNELKNYYSYKKDIDLKWLSIWIYGIICFAIIDGICGGLFIIYPSVEIILSINILFLTMLIWYIGYYGLNQSQVVLFDREERHIQKEKPTKITEKNDYLRQELTALFSEKKIYRNQNLSLRETSELLGISDKQLSNYINNDLKSNFYELVNSYRIKDFKKRLLDEKSKNITLLGLAFDSGFNSKATFNRVFKQQEGITPFQYKKQVEKGLITSIESI